MRTRFEENEEDPSVNLTPLIDIVFVILMAFMVAMPLIHLDSIALAPGSSQLPALDQQDSHIVIKVFADSSIALNDQKLPIKDLETHLRPLCRQHPNTIPLLLQDGETPFKLYQEVKTRIEAAGFHQLHIALS